VKFQELLYGIFVLLIHWILHLGWGLFYQHMDCPHSVTLVWSLYVVVI